MPKSFCSPAYILLLSFQVLWGGLVQFLNAEIVTKIPIEGDFAGDKATDVEANIDLHRDTRERKFNSIIYRI